MSERSVPRAPAGDGGVVAEPPLREAAALVSANRRRLHAHGEAHTLLGRSWADLRRRARKDAVAAARAYLGEPEADASGSPSDVLLVAGHQPELFHPGVWVKNFALCGLARARAATPLNLVVDNDTVKTTALWLPECLPSPPAGRERSGVRGEPRRRAVLFDRWTGGVPWEERAVADRELFATFAGRAGALLRGWGYEPMLADFWAEVLRQAERTPLVGECFAAARRAFERAWGCHNLEVPLSAVCRTEAFAWFACDLLADLPRFHARYNAAVADYRRRHGIRDRNHPVPDLAADGDWREAPLWAWRAGGVSPRRKRLFVRPDGDRLRLRADDEEWPSLPRPDGERAEVAVRAWQGLEARGLKVRSRALTTTLYARLFLADLFLHGIGGGKYDELTDELMRRQYGCEPPAFVVLTATRWLPLPRPTATPDDRRRLLRAVRDLHYNPQRHLDEADADGAFADLAARKREWIARRPETRDGRRERFQSLRALTEELRRPLRRREEQLREQLRLCERQLRAGAVLRRRDYAFCLFSADSLRPFLTRFLTAPDWC